MENNSNEFAMIQKIEQYHICEMYEANHFNLDWRAES